MTQALNVAIESSQINSSGILQPAGGGTGAGTLTANNVLLGNGTSAVQTVAPGANGNLLTSNGTTWVSQAAPSGMVYPGAGVPLSTGSAWGTSFNNSSNPISVSYGGTGLTSITSTYVPYGNGTTALNTSSNFTYNGTYINSGGGTVQYSPKIAVRATGNNYEFGHTNTAGYGSTIGAESGSGAPFIGFNTGAGTTGNTYKTLGLAGTVIRGDNAGGLGFYTVSNTNADNQSLTTLATLNSSGTFAATSFSGAGTGLTGTASSLTVGTATNATNATTATNLSGGTVSATTISATGGYTATSAAPFYLSATTVSSNYTSPANYNLMSVGPVTINTGVTVTIDTTGNWVIL